MGMRALQREGAGALANRVIEGARRAVARALLGRGAKDWQSYLMQRMTGALPYDKRSYVGDDDYLAAPAKVSWVYACCRIISEAFSRPAWWLEDDAGQRVEIPELQRLLRRPNPYTSGRELFEATMWHLLLTGKAYWYLSEMSALSLFRQKDGALEVGADGAAALKQPERPLAGGTPREIWALPPDRVKPVAGSEGVLFDHFVYRPSAAEYRLPAEAVIYFRLFDPRSMTDGLGVVEAAARILESDQHAQDYQRSFFRNSALPSGILASEQELTEDQAQRLAAWWRQGHLGTDQAHRVAILDRSVKFQPIAMSHKDMAFLEQRAFTMQEILAMFGVPPSKVAQMKDTNRATAAEEDKTFWAECMEPKLLRFADKVSAELASRWREGARFVFEDVTPDDLEQESQIAARLVEKGIWTINEARERFGWGERVAWGDAAWMPENLRPADTAAAPAAEGQRELARQVAAFLREQEREATEAARAGRRPLLDWAEQDRRLEEAARPALAGMPPERREAALTRLVEEVNGAISERLLEAKDAEGVARVYAGADEIARRASELAVSQQKRQGTLTLYVLEHR